MLFTKIVSSLALVAAAQAFTIPQGQKDGVYSVYKRADGTEVHTNLSAGSPVKRSSVSLVAKRDTDSTQGVPDPQTYCGCGFNMDHGNCDWAVQNMKDQLGGGDGSDIPDNQSFYAVGGQDTPNPIVAFACARGQGGLLNADTFGSTIGQVTNDCGFYITGARELEFTNLVIGYQRWSAGDDFCADATSSPAHSC